MKKEIKTLTEKQIRVVTGYEILGEVFKPQQKVTVKFFEKDILQTLEGTLTSAGMGKIFLNYEATEGDFLEFKRFKAIDLKDLYSIE